MLQIGLYGGFKYQVFQWDCITVTVKEPIGLIEQTDLSSFDMRKINYSRIYYLQEKRDCGVHNGLSQA